MTPLGQFEQMAGKAPVEIRRYRLDMIGCRLRINPRKRLKITSYDELRYPVSSQHCLATELLKPFQIDKAKLVLQRWLARFVQRTEDSISGRVQDLTVQHLADGWYIVAVVHAFRDVHPDDRDRLRQVLNSPTTPPSLYTEVSISAMPPSNVRWWEPDWEKP